jgi:hypothetical protein
LYADTFSENEQGPLLLKTKNTNMAGGLNLKLTFCFMETTYEALHLDKRIFGQ